MKRDKYPGWDCTGGYLLAYALPLKKICLTGKRPSGIAALDPMTAQAVIEDGRGWDNKDRNSFYDKLDQKELIRRLGSWSPVVRERAAMALARRGEVPLDDLLKMLASSDLESRYGACQALAMLKSAAAPAVPELRKALRHDDLWLRVEAAEALVAIGPPAMVAVPELLEMLAKEPSQDDPRGMEQRYLCFAVFGQMLKRALDGVDRDLLRQAVAAGLHNQDGRARGTVGGIYQQLSYEEIKPLLPAVHEAIVTPAPSGIMFASGIRLAGIDLLAKHRIAEGMPLCIETMEIEKWGKRDRISRCLKTLAIYGGAAKSVLPQLRQLEKDLLAHKEAKGLQPQIDQLRALIANIKSATDAPELRSIGGL